MHYACSSIAPGRFWSGKFPGYGLVALQKERAVQLAAAGLRAEIFLTKILIAWLEDFAPDLQLVDMA
jgi:hypothetical protein